MPTPLDPRMRLLSPTKTRIYPNPSTGVEGNQEVGPVFAVQRGGLSRGQADAVTMAALLKLGWKQYEGPARTDDRGWVIPGTDPTVRPLR